MRNERLQGVARAVQLGPSGEIVEAVQLTKASAEIDDSDLNDDLCNQDYTWGKLNQNSCDERSLDTKSGLNRAQCEWAAKQAGAVVDNVHESLHPEWEDKHPYGCFMYPCLSASSNAGKQCYFYNEDGDTPQHPKGVPVCERPKYLYGIAVANKDLTATDFCSDLRNIHENESYPSATGQYAVVDDETACRKAASCLGDCAGSLFLTGVHNASKQEEAPPGCYLAANETHDVPCVYFNKATLGPPTTPVGTPICVAKPDQVTELPAGYGATVSEHGGEDVSLNKTTAPTS
jgi:hypothetical protein